MKNYPQKRSFLFPLIFAAVAAFTFSGCQFYDDALRELKNARYDEFLLAKFLFLDATPPTVTSIIPDSEASGVARNMTVSAIFSEDIDPETVTPANFVVTRGGAAVDGTLRCVRNSVIFKPVSNFEPNTPYDIVVHTGLKDRAGNALEEQFSWFFKTGAEIDIIPPNVTYSFPSSNSNDAPTNTALNLVFSENIDPSTVTNDTFIITSGGEPVEGELSSIKNIIIFKPSKEMAQMISYSVRVTTGIKDLAGNAMAAEYLLNFSTSNIRDEIPPVVTRTQPGDKDDGVETNPNINIIFSENIHPGTINTENIILTEDGRKIKGVISCNNNTVTFRPISRLEMYKSYRVVITSNVTDMAGNRLNDPYIFTFTTGNGLDSTPPSILDVYPYSADNSAFSENINIISIQFSEEIQFGVVLAVAYEDGEIRVPVSGAVSYNQAERILQFVPDSGTLPWYRRYHVSVSSVKDLAGNSMSGDVYAWSFVIGSYIDTTPPLIDHVTPADGSIESDDVTSVRVYFNEEIQSDAHLEVCRENGAGCSEVSGSVSYDKNQGILQFVPNSNIFERYSQYNVKVSNVNDLAGNPLNTTYSAWSFVVGSNVVLFENASSQNLGYGTFGTTSSGRGYLLRDQEGNSLLGIFQYGQVLNSFFDTNIAGTMSDGKYMRMVHNGNNILDFSLSIVAVDINNDPQKGIVNNNIINYDGSPRIFIDPVNGRFQLPRPLYWSQCINEPDIPTIQAIGYPPAINRSGTIFTGGMFYYTSSWGKESETLDDSYTTLYPFGEGYIAYMWCGTISVWWKPTSSGQVRNEIRLNISERNYISAICNESAGINQIQIAVDNTLAPNPGIGLIQNNEWNHLYVVWNPFGIDGDPVNYIKVYINGQLAATSQYGYRGWEYFNIGLLSSNNFGNGSSAISNLKIWEDVVVDNPSFEWNNGAGRANALHYIYGEECDYQPAFTISNDGNPTNDGGIGYYY